MHFIEKSHLIFTNLAMKRNRFSIFTRCLQFSMIERKSHTYICIYDIKEQKRKRNDVKEEKRKKNYTNNAFKNKKTIQQIHLSYQTVFQALNHKKKMLAKFVRT